MHVGAYVRGAYTWSKTSVKGKEGLSGGGGGVKGREIQYAGPSEAISVRYG